MATITNRSGSLIASALMAVTAITASSCGSRSTPTPEPSPTRAVAQVLPSETPTPTVTITLTPSITPTPVPTTTPVPGDIRYHEAERGCEIPRAPDVWTMKPVPEASDQARTEWAGLGMPTVSADVVAYSEESRTYHLHPTEPELGHDLLLTYGRDPLPIEVDKSYLFTIHQDQPDTDPLGYALRVEDEEGLVFLGLSARETEGAAELLLEGDRAGFRIRQLPTRCQYAPVDDCGFELRAAPVEFAVGDSQVDVYAGSAERFGRGPAYLAIVYTSFYRMWVRDEPCEDSASYPLSYALKRSSD